MSYYMNASIFSFLQSKHVDQSLLDAKVGASLEQENVSDNIPLRIALLLMDEVFDLRERNQWLRRQIVAVLRQILKAMFGEFSISTQNPPSVLNKCH